MKFTSVAVFVTCVLFPFGCIAIILDPTQVLAARRFFATMGEIVQDNSGNRMINIEKEKENYEYVSRLSAELYHNFSSEKLTSFLNAVIFAAEDGLQLSTNGITKLTEQLWFDILIHDEGQALTKHMNETALPDGSGTILTLFQKFVFGLIHFLQDNKAAEDVLCIEYNNLYQTLLQIPEEIVIKTFFDISKGNLVFRMQEFLEWCKGKTILQLVTLHTGN